MLITVPKADYCALRKKIRIKTAEKSRYQTVSGKPEIIFDSIEYDWRKGRTSFYLYDELAGEIFTSYYSFTVPAKKKQEKTGDVYHLVSICFGENGRSSSILEEQRCLRFMMLKMVRL